MNADRHWDGGSASDAALQRLATYGSLAPGRPNHHQLGGLDGHWLEGKVYRTLVNAGWGSG